MNTLWITVPIQNGNKYLGAGVFCDNSGNCTPTQYNYSAYAGYWPTNPKRRTAALLSSLASARRRTCTRSSPRRTLTA